ncbi:MAG: hypothetical protein Q8S26_08835 [Azonexus sp.]|nr:hypothetical protein [Azonexus sp.]
MGTQKTVKTPQALGAVVAAVRIAQGIRADEFKVSHVCVSNIEHGKDATQIGKVFAVLAELGIRVVLEMPPGLSLPDDNAKMRRRISR